MDRARDPRGYERHDWRPADGARDGRGGWLHDERDGHAAERWAGDAWYEHPPRDRDGHHDSGYQSRQEYDDRFRASADDRRYADERYREPAPPQDPYYDRPHPDYDRADYERDPRYDRRDPHVRGSSRDRELAPPPDAAYAYPDVYAEPSRAYEDHREPVGYYEDVRNGYEDQYYDHAGYDEQRDPRDPRDVYPAPPMDYRERDRNRTPYEERREAPPSREDGRRYRPAEGRRPSYDQQPVSRIRDGVSPSRSLSRNGRRQFSPDRPPPPPPPPPPKVITLAELRAKKEATSQKRGREDDGTNEDSSWKRARTGGELPPVNDLSDLAAVKAEDLLAQFFMADGATDVNSAAADSSQPETYTMKPELDGKVPEFRDTDLRLPEGVSDEKAAKLRQEHKSRMQRSEQARKKETERDQGRLQSRKATACRFALNGRCTSGADCQWSHDPEVLEEARKANERLPDVCKYFKVGKCEQGDSCEYSHNLKHEPCKFFHWFGTCAAGDRCDYSHAPLNDRQKLWVQNQMRKRLKTQACRFFFAGKCRKTEDECAFSHGPLTPEMESRLHRDLESERRKAWRDGQRRAGVTQTHPAGPEEAAPYVPGL